MSETIYSSSTDRSTNNYASQNNITVALALRGKRLTKIVYPNPDHDVDYDHAYHYKFFNRDVYCLSDIFELVKYLLGRPQCCVLRGVCKDDTLPIQRRLKDETIIEQPQNWYALDVDKYGNSSGNLREDTKKVLLALNMPDVEAFAIPSSGYLRKPGIRIRLFLWNSVKINCATLKKHFEKSGVVDLALFSSIQPIYIARPIFRGFTDPCKILWTWISGEKQFTEIPPLYTNYDNRREERYTTRQAQGKFNKLLREMYDIKEGDRHNWLIYTAISLGKWIYQGALIEEDVVEELYLATAIWRGNRKKDMDTIVDGIQRGKRKIQEEENGMF